MRRVTRVVAWGLLLEITHCHAIPCQSSIGTATWHSTGTYRIIPYCISLYRVAWCVIMILFILGRFIALMHKASAKIGYMYVSVCIYYHSLCKCLYSSQSPSVVLVFLSVGYNLLF